MARAASSQGSSGQTWYRSLYWRVALGFVGFLAVLLVAQGALFVWMARNTGGLFPATSNARLAELVASDIRERLEEDPRLDVAAHVTTEYGRSAQPFVVVFTDGRNITSRRAVPPALVRNARVALARANAGRPLQRLRRPGVVAAGPSFMPIVINGGVVGLVAVPAGSPPLANVLGELGPTMAVSGLVLLAIGAAASSALVFGPVRKRLGELEAAARRFGAGDVTARAPEHGADEVASLARSFNRMAADLQARVDALAAADRARRQLLADVSHELMTPLTAMRGYVETLAMAELRLDASMRERYLRIVDEETRRLERIVGDLLDLARLEGGGAALRRDPVPVSALFSRVATRYERQFTERRIAFIRQIGPDAEAITGDMDRLEQVLQNLAANALRHLPDGGTLTMAAQRTGDTIRLTVRDNGPGIAPEHLPLIFDRFYKADAARASAGSGLGLSIVKTIVDAHGGTISARNEDGAVFDITLPV
ncbi:MAG: HAMP domain-containing sensor histidine kinase [Vicinamibacterales bacterium]